MSGERVSVTTGLSRYSPAHAVQAEQVYVDRIVEPDLIPHPDGGFLTPRTFSITRARGYRFERVLDLTEQQAVEMAKIILREAEGPESHPHPDDIRQAAQLRESGRNMSAIINKLADWVEGKP